MNAGKSTILLQSSYNYRERGMHTLVLSPVVDDRFGIGKVSSRIGLQSESIAFSPSENLFRLIQKEHAIKTVHCVLIDESQFLTKLQVRQLSDICDELDVPVLAYGLRTDFQGNLFEGYAERSKNDLPLWAQSNDGAAHGQQRKTGPRR